MTAAMPSSNHSEFDPMAPTESLDSEMTSSTITPSNSVVSAEGTVETPSNRPLRSTGGQHILGSNLKRSYDASASSQESLRANPRANTNLGLIEELCKRYDEQALTPSGASELLQRLAGGGSKCVIHDWCWLSSMKTNKPIDGSAVRLVDKVGYIQVSHGGANKFNLLHHFAAFAGTRRAPADDEEASHLCGHSVCFNPRHLIWERSGKNQSRKGCQVWIDLPEVYHQQHLPARLLVCPHGSPVGSHCVKAVPDVSEGDFLANRRQYIYGV